jgi:serine protease
VITVAATTRSGARAGYTNIGNRVDISAPGGESANAIPVLYNTGLTDPGDDVIAYALGTSFATAQVAGVAALILAHNTELSPRQVEEILKSSARPFPDTSCDTTTCGAGIVDAERALVIAENTLPEMPATDTVVSSGGGGGGGGGCTIRTKASVDSSWLLIIIGFGIGFMRQRHIKH